MNEQQSLEFAIAHAGKLYLDLQAAIGEINKLRQRVDELEGREHAGTVRVEPATP